MAVFIWATGAVPAAVSAAGTLTFSVNNRTASTQTGVAALWNNASGSTKVLAGSVVTFVLGANTANVLTLTNGATTLVTAEVEIRVPDQHMDVFMSSQTNFTNTYLPGSFFRDSDSTGTP